MKVQKLMFTMSLAFVTLTSMTTPIDLHLFTAKECERMIQFNNIMNEKLGLTNQQLEVILNFNKDYWTSRKNIIDKSNMAGQNTALLACWDEWRIALAKQLTPSQMEKFMQWQSQVDLLGGTPF